MSSFCRHTIDGPAGLQNIDLQNNLHNQQRDNSPPDNDLPGINEASSLAQRKCTPAFYNSEDNTVRISRFQNGKPAPIHISTFLPESWLIDKRFGSRVPRIKNSVSAGYVINGEFYSRDQAQSLCNHFM